MNKMKNETNSDKDVEKELEEYLMCEGCQGCSGGCSCIDESEKVFQGCDKCDKTEHEYNPKDKK
jgi:hypothetical protein